MGETPKDISAILRQVGAGEKRTAELMPAVYAELRSMADGLMRRERGHHTLQPTALVHEAFVRLVDSENIGEKGRLKFLEAAAVTMRRVLVDYAREAGADKRGANWRRVTLQGLEEDGPGGDDIDVLQLHDALESLAELDPRQAKVVELRFFSGMTGQEIADHLGISRNTVVRELSLSRAWLHRELSRGA